MQKDIQELVNAEVEAMKSEEVGEIIVIEKPSNTLPVAEDCMKNSAVNVISNTKGKILAKAQDKINQEKIIDKHAENLSKVADESLKADIEKEKNEVRKKEATNKEEKQAIKNRLIVLKNEAKRLRKDEKHKNKIQKAELEAANKKYQWEKLKDTLEPLGYTYVPNFIALNILLMLNGLKAFFNGVGKVGTAALKCFKWILFLAVAITIIMVIPVTREWVLELLGYIK